MLAAEVGCAESPWAVGEGATMSIGVGPMVRCGLAAHDSHFRTLLTRHLGRSLFSTDFRNAGSVEWLFLLFGGPQVRHESGFKVCQGIGRLCAKSALIPQERLILRTFSDIGIRKFLFAENPQVHGSSVTNFVVNVIQTPKIAAEYKRIAARNCERYIPSQ